MSAMKQTSLFTDAENMAMEASDPFDRMIADVEAINRRKFLERKGQKVLDFGGKTLGRGDILGVKNNS